LDNRGDCPHRPQPQQQQEDLEGRTGHQNGGRSV